MGRLSLICLACLGLAVSGPIACGGGGGNGDDDGGVDGGPQPCDLAEHACPAGQRCTQDQECVDADALAIVTEALPAGRVGFGYDQTLEAAGGLTPYAWEIASADPSLAFLTITSAGRLRGTPAEVVEAASLTVAVADSGFGGGERVERTFEVSFDACHTGDTELCYTPSAGLCYQGSRTCTDGQMGPCEAGPNPSADRNYCGPECTRCDAAVADACYEGACACGAGALCTGDDNCCDGSCVDTDATTAHCGMCFNDCAQTIAHAEGAEKFCAGGLCDYTGACDYGYLDCDGQRGNGCERPANRVDTCGGCDVDCNDLVTHVPGAQKLCTDAGAEFVCDYAGSCSADFDDCDADRSNGCETWLTQPTDCGGCGVDCSQAAAGALCISPDGADPYFHTCGCNFDSQTGASEGCGPGQICCDHVCRDAAGDPDHCGVCDAACGVGGCDQGACGCAVDGDCPALSAATSCAAGGRCACAHAGAADAPCPLGQFCCDGSAGGTGGPDGEADLGCCVERCGQNASDQIPCTQ